MPTRLARSTRGPMNVTGADRGTSASWGGVMHRRRALRGIVVLALAAFHSPKPAAQPGTKESVIGLLDASERPDWWAALRQELRDLGYVEGRNAKFEQRYAKGNL